MAATATSCRLDRRQEDGPKNAPSGIIKFHVPEIVFGPGSLAEAGFAARRLGAERPFVVTDPGIIEAGWTAALVGYLAGP